MTVYADVLVIVNLYIDFFLLWCVKKAFHLKAAGLRLVLGGLLGGLCALTSLLPGLPMPVSLLLGILTALGVTAAAFCPLPPKAFCRAAAGFWSFAMLLAGFFLFLLRFFAPKNVAVLGTAVYFDLSPLLLFVFTCGAYLVFTLARKLLPGGSHEAALTTLTVENRGVTVTLWAKADTGNDLREPFSGLPVIVCRGTALKGTVPPPVTAFLETGGSNDLTGFAEGFRLVPFESLGGTGVLPAFRPQRVTAGKEPAALDCWIAVCRQALSAGQFDALYNPDQFSFHL